MLADPTDIPTQTVSPSRELLAIAIPTVMQMASYTVMQFLDTLMLSHAVGPIAPAAASNAGIFAYSIIGLGMGTLFIVNALVSQHFGAGDFRACGRYLWQGVWISVIFSIFALLPIAYFFPPIFTHFKHAPEFAEMEKTYARIMFAFGGFKLVQTAFSQFMLGTNRPNSVLWSSVIGVAVNAVAAYVMLFGKLGIQPMGLRGAAYGQAIGMIVEMATLVIFSLRDREDRNKFGAFDWKLRAAEMKTLLRVGLSSGFQFSAEVLAWSLFMNWVFGQLGEIAMEANAFMFRYVMVTFFPAVGISSAVTALVGRYIGMKRFDLATQRAHLGYRVAVVYLLIVGTIYIAFRHELIRLFTIDPQVVRLGAILMIFAAFYELFDGMYIIYIGALRGAGDTFIPACVTSALCWTVMLLGGYATTRYRPEWSVAGPWSAASLYGITIGLFMLIRFNRGQWKSISVDRDV